MSYTITASKGAIQVFFNGNVVIRQEGGSQIELSLEETKILAKALFGECRAIIEKKSPQPPKLKPKTSLPKRSKSVSSSYMAKQKAIHENAYQPWTTEDDQKLRKMAGESRSVPEMANALGRNEGSIRSRMKKLGL